MKNNTSNGRDDRNGDSPHFQLDLLGVEGSGENGDSPHTPRIRVSPRARRLSVRVYPDARVEVVVPPRARAREVEQFLAAQRQWIDDKRAVALRNCLPSEPFPPATLNFAATRETWRLHLAGGDGRLRIIEVANDGGHFLNVSGRVAPSALRDTLRAWLMRAAQARLAPRVTALAQATGTRFSRVSIRRQRSRWGSCSVRGTISLNACLLFQRPEVVDYLIVHELTHVRHMNHSARFWQAVEQHCPGWRSLDRELVDGWRHVPRWVFTE
jgi:predicted metal-dependent hydrolase